MADTATMRDRGKFWSPVPDWANVSVKGDGWTARRVAGLGQALVTGDVEAARAALCPQATEAGLWSVTAGDALVRIARDKALLVTPSPLAAGPVWRAGFAATPADDAWAVFDIAGEGLAGLVAEGTAADLEAGSRSASVMFAGIPALIYRTASDTARLHVEAPLAAYLWSWLEAAE